MDVLDDEIAGEAQDNKPTIDELINNGYHWSFGDYWQKSMDIFKEVFGWVALYTLIVGIAGSVLGLVPGLSQLWNNLITPVLYCGIMIHASAVVMNRKPDFGDHFQVFKHFGQLLIYRLIVLIIGTLFAIPFLIDLFDFGIIQILGDQIALQEAFEEGYFVEDFMVAFERN